MSRKINQEQIKIDRRLAWERVKELLGGDEDEEEEEEEGAGASKLGTRTDRYLYPVRQIFPFLSALSR